MALYYYRAKSGPDKVVEGKIEATTREEAIKKIEQLGYFPIKVEESLSTSRILEIPAKNVKIKRNKIIQFTRQLATLIKAGVPILKALGVIVTQTKDVHLKGVVNGTFCDIKDGCTFSAGLAKYQRIFSPFYIFMIKAGEDSGTLGDVLFRIADYQEKEQEIVSKIKIALVYPIVMFCVGLGTVIFMLTFVMPRLMAIFSDMQSSLPLPTKILLFCSNFLREKWPIFIGLVVLFIFIFKRLSGTKEIRLMISKFCLGFPLVRIFVIRREIARFSRTLQMLLKSGISILKALELTIPILDNEIMKSEFIFSQKELEGGVSLGASLRKSKIFPVYASSLISIGEESGKLDDTLGELASIYEKELEENIKVFTTLIEPVMILLMGLVVGFIVIAMMLPILQLNLMVQ